MDQKTDEYFKKLSLVLKPIMDKIDNYNLPEVSQTFALASNSIIHFYFSMAQADESKEILHDMFCNASATQLFDTHRILVFWFLWQRDKARNLTFLKSEKIRDGLKTIWSFSDSELNYLSQSFDAKKEPGTDTLCLWLALQNILGNNTWSPMFVFPLLSNSLKAHWKMLDASVGDSI